MTNNVNAVKERLEEQGLICAFQECSKPGKNYTGLIVKANGYPTGLSVDVDSIEKMVEKHGMENTIATLKNHLMDSKKVMDEYDPSNYEWVKEHLILQAIPIKGNELMLESIPHIMLEDLAIIARIKWREYTTIIKENLLNLLMVDSKTLFADAISTSEKKRPITIHDTGVLPLCVCTAGNLGELYGASVLAYPSFSRFVFNKLGGSFYILPSSQHEILLHKDNQDITKEELLEMVCKVNETEVPDEERLSNSVYYCDGVSIRKVA